MGAILSTLRYFGIHLFGGFIKDTAGSSPADSEPETLISILQKQASEEKQHNIDDSQELYSTLPLDKGDSVLLNDNNEDADELNENEKQTDTEDMQQSIKQQQDAHNANVVCDIINKQKIDSSTINSQLTSSQQTTKNTTTTPPTSTNDEPSHEVADNDENRPVLMQSIPVGQSLDLPDSPEQKQSEACVEQAAIKIQALVRGHLARKALKGADGLPLGQRQFDDKSLSNPPSAIFSSTSPFNIAPSSEISVLQQHQQSLGPIAEVPEKVETAQIATETSCALSPSLSQNSLEKSTSDNNNKLQANNSINATTVSDDADFCGQDSAALTEIVSDDIEKLDPTGASSERVEKIDPTSVASDLAKLDLSSVNEVEDDDPSSPVSDVIKSDTAALVEEASMRESPGKESSGKGSSNADEEEGLNASSNDSDGQNSPAIITAKDADEDIQNTENESNVVNQSAGNNTAATPQKPPQNHQNSGGNSKRKSKNKRRGKK